MPSFRYVLADVFTNEALARELKLSETCCEHLPEQLGGVKLAELAMGGTPQRVTQSTPNGPTRMRRLVRPPRELRKRL